MTSTSWKFAAAMIVGCVLAACSGGSGAGDPACASDCVVPPAPVCADDLLIRYAPNGSCEDGTCQHEVQSTTTCELGCDAGACIEATDPCDGVTCEPSAPTCDGDRVVTQVNGRCEDGTCAFDDETDDCAARGEVCEDGACVDPCAGVVCDAPPADACDGGQRVLWDAAGTCVAGTCEYTSETTDCAARGEACEDAACVPIACDTECDDPSPGCEGDIAVASHNGACLEGTCHWDVTRTDCAVRGQTCVEGACVAGPCHDVVCDAGPEPRCVGTVLREYEVNGTCADGACDYPFIETDCADDGMSCVAGRCVADPCADVTCDEPPVGRCEDGVAVSFVDGACLGGRCEWSERRESCIAEGLVCAEGACVDPCEGVDACDAPPAPRCADASFLVTSLGPGVCGDDGRCQYTEFATDCAALGETCIDGACRDACYGVTCEEPPADRCDDTTALAFAAAGVCDPDTTECAYAITRTNCALDGLVCVDGACVEDPCDTLVCDTPPAGTCDGNVASTPFGEGLCLDGSCQYAERTVDCTELGETCLDGACRDICYGVLCDVPPRPACEGSIAVVSADAGTCSLATGLCRYDRETTNCALDGLVCIDGACVEDPCEGVVCDEVPASTCDEGVLTSYALPGVCERGTCEYRTSERVCADEGLQCLDGACVPLCTGVTCDEVPAPTCEGDILLTSTAGTCDDLTGDCTYPVDVTDCAASGQICLDGACVVDPCDRITCDTPGSRCDGDFRLVGVAPGVCERGVCTYDETVEDCTVELGGTCVDGECVIGDPCDDILCDAPPPTDCADGTTARTWADIGTCADEVCTYAATLTPCEGGLVCELGSCVPNLSCDGITCDSPPEPYCTGTVASTWLADGECFEGTCVYETVDRDCADDGLACEDGACIIPCAGGCTDPPATLCISGTDLLREYVSPGLCGDDEFCSYDWTESDCADDDLVCIGDACVVDPCEIDVVCPDAPDPICGDGVDAPVESLIVFGTECLRGECSVVEEAIDCTLLPGYCDEGACVEGDRCDDVVCPDLPNDCFEGRYAVTYTLPECDSTTGECTYDEEDEDCFVDGLGCFEGACVEGLYPEMVILTELMVFPESGGQWIELFNVTSGAQSLEGLTFTIAGSGATFTIDADVTIPAEGHVVLGSTEAVAGGLSVDHVWGSETAFALPGGAGTLTMGIDGRQLDRIEWDATWPFGPGVAAQLNNGNEDGDENADPTNWCAATVLYDGVNRGTPGAENLDCPEDEDPDAP